MADTILSATPHSDANRIPMSQLDGSAVSGSVTSAATLFTVDMLGYESITVQITSAGTTCTITYETSDDNSTWLGCAGLHTTAVGNAAPVLTSTTAAMYRFPRYGRYFRARVSTYTSGTVTVVGTLSKAPVVITLGLGSSQLIQGAAAHDAAVSGNPVRVAGRGLSANYAAVSTGDTTDLVTDLVGSLVTLPYGIPDISWQYASTADITDTNAVEAKAAVASQRNYVSSISVSNTDATVGTYVEVRSASTVIDVFYVPPQTAATNGNPSITKSYPVMLRGGVNEAINVACLTTSAQVRVGINGVTKAA